MSSKPRLLFTVPRNPFPPIGGDKLRSYWLVKLLSKHFDIHLIFIDNQEVNHNFHGWVELTGISYKVFRKKKLNHYISTLKGLMTSDLPLQVNYYYFDDVKAYIDRNYKNFDILFSSLIRTAEYIIDKDKPKILDMTDSIAQNYQRSRWKTYSLKWKLLYNIEYERVLNYEKRCIEKFDKTLFVNDEERKYFQNEEKTVLIQNGVNPGLLEYNKQSQIYENYVVFFGKMDYQPNIDAVMWFAENVLPFLDKNIKFVIVGANPAKIIKNLEKKHDNVYVTGFLDDPYILIKSALCVVSPMLTGAGIQNKILESMALGTINIISSLAAISITGKNLEHFIISDDPLEIAQIIKRIKSNPIEYEHIKIKSREFIKENYTWDVVEKKLLQTIKQIIPV